MDEAAHDSPNQKTTLVVFVGPAIYVFDAKPQMSRHRHHPSKSQRDRYCAGI